MSTYSRYPSSPQPGVRLWPFLLLLALLGVLVWRYWPTHFRIHNPSAGPRAVTPRGPLAPDEITTIDIFRTASPSVVHITTLAARGGGLNLEQQNVPKGTGSGFIWDVDPAQGGAWVVTNFHVIAGATAAEVTLDDHTSHNAQLVGADEKRDLAVLWIDGSGSKLQKILVGKSADLQVGQKVFAIGNPFGLDHTLTRGIISALGRSIEGENGRPIKKAIQTDAAINPGNSGGPLLDSAGRLIGVNTAIFSPSKVSAGIGFAIAVDDVNRVVPQLIRSGRVTRPTLGIQEAPQQVARRLGLKDGSGVLILTMDRGGPADKAGLEPTRRDRQGGIRRGDVIVAVDGKKVTSSDELYDLIEAHNVGDKVTLTVLRESGGEDGRPVMERLNKDVVLQAERE